MRTLRELVFKELYGGLWHTTHPERFKGILNVGAILPEPNISDKERWKTSQGIHNYPYVRFLGGISLFDFDNFNLDSYYLEYPSNSLDYFVPICLSWDSAVWIEINRKKVTPNLISGPNLRTKWEKEKAYSHPFMALVEAAHIGPLYKTAFKRAFYVSREDEIMTPIEI